MPHHCGTQIQARMNLVEDKIVHLLTGKSNLREVTVGELEAITQEQPFFSIAQLLLAKKMKQENHPAFQQQVAKTALYFPNTYWLDSQLQDEATQQGAPHTVIHSTVTHGAVEVTATGNNNTAASASAPSIAEPLPQATEPVEEQSAAAVPEENSSTALPPQHPEAEGEIVVTGEHVTVETFTPSAEPLPQAEEPVEEKSAAAEPVSAGTGTENALSAGEAPLPHPEEPAVDESPATQEEHPPAASSYEQSIRASFQAAADKQGATDEDNLPVEEIGEKPGEPDGISNMKLAEMLQQQAEAFQKRIEPDTQVPIGSEPYHTIDYFASQGIKLDNEAAEGDALGKKVRKFTDWLKQMKRINPADLGTDKAQEQAVQGIAAHSIEEREVVTESMAEVLVKQGKIDKAIQVYSKLSFLNPDKSAYFASKILALKET